jgi:transposase InsO family protein
LNRDFTAQAPNRRRVADFTYVSTWAGFVYAWSRRGFRPGSQGADLPVTQAVVDQGEEFAGDRDPGAHSLVGVAAV